MRWPGLLFEEDPAMSESNHELFNKIASAYNLFYGYQRRGFRRTLDQTSSILSSERYTTILDVGCGTGALASSLSERGFKVTGIDASVKMLAQARKRKRHQDLTCLEANVMERLPFEDDSFDVAIASHVAHGMFEQERKHLYEEMARVAKSLVIFHDYNQERSPIISFMEYLEGGDYFNFIQVAQQEMAQSFPSVEVVDLGGHTAWYVCKVS